jgi:deferrochelatase/peroxidase EfeB
MSTARETLAGRLQPGIYIERGVPPPAALRLLFLDVEPGASAADAAAAIGGTMAMLADLQGGRMRELATENAGDSLATVPAGSFDVLIGYGASLFARGSGKTVLTSAERPAHLVALRRDGPAFPSLPWDPTAIRDGAPSGEADILLQFTGRSEHAVARAAVEVLKLIAEQDLPLSATGSYGGFQRDDGRSWIGFHDGVTNIEPSQRLAAVQCPGDPGWNRGGTFLAFLRIEIDLGIWRRLSRVEQELVVGRDKLSGCPLGSIDRIGDGLLPRPIAAKPPTTDSGWRERDAYFNPPETTDPLLEVSHVHRANQARAAGETPSGERIFRQGYEYLDDIGPDGPRLGLNFISFQRDLECLRQILGLSGWLGDVNFGGRTEPGPGEPEAPPLLALRAGGFYAVPPRGKAFPGADLLTTTYRIS